MFEESAIAIHDPRCLGGGLGWIALLRDGLLADETRVSTVEALHETSCELALVPQSRTAGLLGQEILERAVLLSILVEQPEDARHAPPHRALQRHLAAIGSVVLAKDGDGGEPGLLEETTSLGRIAVNELGAHFHRDTGVRVVESQNSPA